jgi:hypothetical protein
MHSALKKIGREIVIVAGVPMALLLRFITEYGLVRNVGAGLHDG